MNFNDWRAFVLVAGALAVANGAMVTARSDERTTDYLGPSALAVSQDGGKKDSAASSATPSFSTGGWAGDPPCAHPS